MQSRTLSLQVPPEDAKAYEMASPEEQRKVDDALRRQLRQLMKALPAAVRDPNAADEASQHHPGTEIHPEVLKISGLVPPDVDAHAEYREYLMKKHR